LGAGVREWSIGYLVVVVGLLVVSTTIDDDEGVSLTHILIAAFGWPLFAPIMVWRTWFPR
jgi:hypothetical protein